MNVYRIYTERFENDKAQTIMTRYFDAFTMIPTTGFWKGTREDSVVFEVLTDDSDKVLHAADTIREELNQEAVLVVRMSCGSVLVDENTYASSKGDV